MIVEDKSKVKNDLDILAIKSFFMSKLRYDFKQVGLFEFGINRRRFDCIIINAHSRRIRGYEFKVNRSDFLKDNREGKWKKYLKYCHTFTGVCPPGIIRREEIESPAGLLWVWREDREEYDFEAKEGSMDF